ncbi:MAG TPA: DUF3579 domain-containing protein [Gammaproteobacteria bacterium]|nr:DUF3579 domain-containing protein [Gammaproteobacteria bacterium]
MNKEKLVIDGIRMDGSRLRPSDWIERISSMVAEFGPDHRLHYSVNVHPCVIEGQKCLVVEPELREKNRELYEYILHFAQRNDLVVHLKEETTDSVDKEINPSDYSVSL